MPTTNKEHNADPTTLGSVDPTVVDRVADLDWSHRVVRADRVSRDKQTRTGAAKPQAHFCYIAKRFRANANARPVQRERTVWLKGVKVNVTRLRLHEHIANVCTAQGRALDSARTFESDKGGP